MNDTIAKFIRANNIDTFQKLRFLLFLRQNPEGQAHANNLLDDYISAIWTC